MESTIDRGTRKTREGIVVSDKMDKTIVVSVERRVRHAIYGKEIRVSKKFHAHDEKDEARAGDLVRIMETRPLSRLKRWRLVEILKRGRTNEASNDTDANQSAGG